jgi:hypothetical protein
VVPVGRSTRLGLGAALGGVVLLGLFAIAATGG